MHQKEDVKPLHFRQFLEFAAFHSSNQTGNDIGVFSSPDVYFKYFSAADMINFTDVLALKEREDFWTSLVRRRKNYINTTIELSTDVRDKITVPVTAELKKP
mmetsp:Transcript_29356/g.44279  ORF Transcript_29356/g.44279 Transcript_29356/m.44279 type:complete len:102 (-) Transcript_29356:8062-8367(-)